MDELSKRIAICLEVYKTCILVKIDDERVLMVNPALLKNLTLEEIALSLDDGNISEEHLIVAMEAIDHARKYSTSVSKNIGKEAPPGEPDD